MTTSDFKEIIVEKFGFHPTQGQYRALDVFASFLASKPITGRASIYGQPIMILRGSAGTGKTSIISAMVRTLVSLRQKVQLLAPTGRAAKVLAQNCRLSAGTIHRKIYRQKSVGGAFTLDINLHTDTLFVIDEASMISTQPGQNDVFGSAGSSLLDDLMTYVYSGSNCRMMLIGDTAQLPPVGEQEAPALMNDTLVGYGLQVYQCDLNEVVRQQQESGILWNATIIRNLIVHDSATELPRIRFHGFADIQMISGTELIEKLEDSYGSVGLEETIVVTRSNKRANTYNNGIRVRVLDHEGELCSGDRVMVVHNHYFSKPLEEECPLSFIANGDIAEVRRMRNMRQMYGFTFVDLTLRFPDYNDYELQITSMLDVLQAETPSMSSTQQQQLFDAIMEDYAFLPHKADRLKAIKEDEYYNALQLKYAYAVTCHKAQGGQWKHVYVDQGYMTDDMLTADYIHWLYTAFTRATGVLYLVNWPDNQILPNTKV